MAAVQIEVYSGSNEEKTAMFHFVEGQEIPTPFILKTLLSEDLRDAKRAPQPESVYPTTIKDDRKPTGLPVSFVLQI